jgi:hypothetical protein
MLITSNLGENPHDSMRRDDSSSLEIANQNPAESPWAFRSSPTFWVKPFNCKSGDGIWSVEREKPDP